MNVKISALGTLKNFLPQEKNIELNDDFTDLKTLIIDSVGIPPTESRVCYVVNGRIQKETYVLQPDDKIVVMRMGGAG